MKMRLTADNHAVEYAEMVWEVMYEYLNPEISLAYPESRSAIDIPDKWPIYKDRWACQMVCNHLNEQNKKYQLW